jgi:hypothetical protein
MAASSSGRVIAFAANNASARARSLFACPRLGLRCRGLAELLFVVGGADAREHGAFRDAIAFFDGDGVDVAAHAKGDGDLRVGLHGGGVAGGAAARFFAHRRELDGGGDGSGSVVARAGGERQREGEDGDRFHGRHSFPMACS